MKNIISSLNQCLEEGQCVLTLNGFAALSQCNAIIEKMKKLEAENAEYHQQTQLIDSIPFYISDDTLLKMINALGIVGAPRESLCPCAHIASKSTLFYSRTIICSREM